MTSSLYAKRSWKRRSRQQLAHEPLCRICKSRGLLTPAEVADHIEPHKGDLVSFFTGELQSLCVRCHNNVKKDIELNGYSTEIGPDGWPVDQGHPAYTGKGVSKNIRRAAVVNRNVPIIR